MNYNQDFYPESADFGVDLDREIEVYDLLHSEEYNQEIELPETSFEIESARRSHRKMVENSDKLAVSGLLDEF